MFFLNSMFLWVDYLIITLLANPPTLRREAPWNDPREKLLLTLSSLFSFSVSACLDLMPLIY